MEEILESIREAAKEKELTDELFYLLSELEG